MDINITRVVKVVINYRGNSIVFSYISGHFLPPLPLFEEGRRGSCPSSPPCVGAPGRSSAAAKHGIVFTPAVCKMRAWYDTKPALRDSGMTEVSVTANLGFFLYL